MPASTRSKDPQPPETHILDFFHDDDGSCAFTARINDERFHIIVDPKRLKGKHGEVTDVLNEYNARLQTVKQQEKAEEGVEDAAEENQKGTRSEDRDSGVDISQDDEGDGAKTKQHKSDSKVLDTENPALELQNWILRSFGDEVPQQPITTNDSDNADAAEQPKTTLEDWYNTPAHYYEVVPSPDGTSLEPIPLSETPELRKRLDDLHPHLPLPQKLRSLPIPWLHPSTLTVLTSSSDPPPIHPSLVRTTLPHHSTAETYFFKPVDPTQPNPTKREIELLHKIHTSGLSSQFNVPRLHALVSHNTSKIQIMGLLLTPIPSPTPLTRLLDSEVSEHKRAKWAKETSRIIDLLHSRGIVWGDAKADNFLVDENDEIWVIDFGGSYTEGWVDEGLVETREGDRMGVGKVVRALGDPDGWTADPEAGPEGMEGPEKELEEEGGEVKDETEVGADEDGVGDKNGGLTEQDEVEGNEREKEKEESKTVSSRRGEKDQEEEEEEEQQERYCYCETGSSGEMVACDGKACSREWFHLSCLGLNQPPKSDKWYCKDCEVEDASASENDVEKAESGKRRTKRPRTEGDDHDGASEYESDQLSDQEKDGRGTRRSKRRRS